MEFDTPKTSNPPSHSPSARPPIPLATHTTMKTLIATIALLAPLPLAGFTAPAPTAAVPVPLNGDCDNTCLADPYGTNTATWTILFSLGTKINGKADSLCQGCAGGACKTTMPLMFTGGPDDQWSWTKGATSGSGAGSTSLNMRLTTECDSVQTDTVTFTDNVGGGTGSLTLYCPCVH